MTDFRFEDLPEQPTAVVRDRVPMDQLKSFFDTVYGTVMGALAEHGAHPAGPPFAKYTGMPSETVDVEAGFPIAAPFDAPGLTDGDGVEAGGRVEAGTLPGGRTAVGTHVGPYEGLTDTYQQMAGWISAQGLIPGPAVWEVYLSDPGQEPDPATWRTEVYWPATEGGAS